MDDLAIVLDRLKSIVLEDYATHLEEPEILIPKKDYDNIVYAKQDIKKAFARVNEFLRTVDPFYYGEAQDHLRDAIVALSDAAENLTDDTKKLKVGSAFKSLRRMKSTATIKSDHTF